jgi:hypothetical protein
MELGEDGCALVEGLGDCIRGGGEDVELRSLDQLMLLLCEAVLFVET